MPTFAAAAEAVLAQMWPGWRNAKHGSNWLSSMERFPFPRLGWTVTEAAARLGCTVLMRWRQGNRSGARLAARQAGDLMTPVK